MTQRAIVAATALMPHWQRRERITALLLLAPSVLYLLAMAVYPTVYSLWLAFHNYTIYRPDMTSFAGFENFTDLFDIKCFRIALINGIIYFFCGYFHIVYPSVFSLKIKNGKRVILRHSCIYYICMIL